MSADLERRAVESGIMPFTEGEVVTVSMAAQIIRLVESDYGTQVVVKAARPWGGYFYFTVSPSELIQAVTKA